MRSPVARLLGRAAAEGAARYMEYNWMPDPDIATLSADPRLALLIEQLPPS